MAEAKRQSIKKVDGARITDGIYAATFADGSTFEASVADVSDEIRHKLLCYGLRQKLDDSMAGAADIEEALQEIRSTWEALKAGQWTMRVAGEGVEGGLFARAYSIVHGISLADAKAKISGLVERNLAANLAKAKDEKAKERITERAVFNTIRDTALARNEQLSATYADLKAKKAGKVKEKLALTVEGLDE